MNNTLDSILEEFEDMSEVERSGEPLSNVRHEIFASHVATGSQKNQAYRIAYNIGDDGNVGDRPSRLMARPEIRKRIGSLLHARTELLINRSLVTHQNVLDELAWGIKSARQDAKYKEHLGYVKTTAQVLGMFIDTDKKAELADKSLEELKAEYELLSSELGIPAPEPPTPATPSLPSEVTENG